MNPEFMGTGRTYQTGRSTEGWTRGKHVELLRKVADLIERGEYKDDEDSFSGPLLEVMGRRLEARNAK